MIKLIAALALFAQRHLALWGQGFLGHFGLGKESTFGTAVAVTDYIEILSESLSESIDRFDTRNIYGGFYEADDQAGLHNIAGDVTMFGHPVSIGHMLKAAMNTVSGSVVLSGFLWQTRFVTTKSDFAYGVPNQPYTLEVFRDVTSSHRYAGCILDKLTLALAPNQDLRVSGSWLGKEAALLTKTAPTFPGSSTEAFAFDTASVQLAGSATARVEQVTVNVDNQLETVATLNNSNVIAQIRRRGPQLVRISGVLDFADVTEWLDFKNQTERAFKVSIFKSQSFNLTIDIPRLRYTAAPTGMSGRQRNLLNFEGKAMYSTSSLVAVDFQLTTIKSNY